MHDPPSSSRSRVDALRLAMLVAAFVALVAAPGRARAAVDQGRPACDYCRMILTDRHFGAEVTLRNGSVKIYDAVECMAAAVLTDSVAQKDIRAVALVDHAEPTARVPLDRTVFLHCPGIESPMGQSLAAFRSGVQAQEACTAGGSVLDWRGVLTQVNTVWFQGKLSVDAHAGVPKAKSKH